MPGSHLGRIPRNNGRRDPGRPAPDVTATFTVFTFNAVGTATSFRCALTARGKKIVYEACKSPATSKKLKPGL